MFNVLWFQILQCFPVLYNCKWNIVGFLPFSDIKSIRQLKKLLQ